MSTTPTPLDDAALVELFTKHGFGSIHSTHRRIAEDARALLEAVLVAGEATPSGDATDSTPFKYCDGCDGYECDAEKGCAYPSVTPAPRELVKRLLKLGHYGFKDSRDARGFFSHTGGRVSLHAASEFYDEAVALAREAADAIAERDRLLEEVRVLLEPFTYPNAKVIGQIHVPMLSDVRAARSLLSRLQERADTLQNKDQANDKNHHNQK